MTEMKVLKQIKEAFECLEQNPLDTGEVPDSFLDTETDTVALRYGAGTQTEVFTVTVKRYR